MTPLVFLLALAQAGGADPAGEALRLHRAGAAAALQAFARKGDPFVLANALLGRHLDGTEGALDAAAVVLPDLAARWRGWDDEARRREKDHRAALLATRGALDRGAFEEARATASAGRDDARPETITPVLLAYDEGFALHHLGRQGDALRAFRRGVTAATELGWDQGRILGLDRLIQVNLITGASREGRQIAEEKLALARTLGRRDLLAEASISLGEAHLRLGEHAKAIEALARAEEEARALGARALLAQVLLDRGAIHGLEGKHRQAAEQCRAALRELEAVGDAEGADRARMNLALSLQQSGAPEEARPLLEEVRRSCEKRGDGGMAAIALGNLGALLQGEGDFEAAGRAFEECLPRLEAAGRRVEAATHRNNLGTVLRHRGETDRAFELHRRARAELVALGARGAATDALQNLAKDLMDRGEFAAALESLEGARAEAGQAGRRDSAAESLRLLAHLHHVLGRYDRALGYAQEALREVEALEDPSQRAAVLGTIGDLYRHLGELDRAEDRLLKALSVLGSAGPRDQSLRLRFTLSSVQIDRGDVDAAEETLQRAARRAEELDARQEAALIEGNLGVVEDRRGHGDRAVRRFEAAAEALRKLGLVEKVAEFQRYAASVHLESGRPEAALRLARAALEREASFGRGFSEDEDPMLRKRGRDASDLGLLAVRACGGSPAEALWFAERGRALKLAEALGRPPGSPSSPPVELAALQRALPAGTAFVLYQLARPRAVALIVDGTGADVVALGDSEALEKEAESWLRLLAVPGSREEAKAAALHEALLRPLGGRLKEARRLVICPDGALAFLPFEALAEEGRRALERWEIAYVPSATVWSALGADAGRGAGLVALGDPVYPGEGGRELAARRDPEVYGFSALPRLPASGSEVAAIGALFPEGERTILVRAGASVDALAAAAARAPGRLRAVHLACHGRIDPGHPRLTGLVLAGGEVLTLERLERLRLPADLAVLSACETGRGAVLRGEGVFGLVRGFFRAGAPRVVVSNWRVADEETRALMMAFYQGMLERGLAPGAALREAKLERRAAAPHPSGWAAFVLWGLLDAAPRAK